MKLGAIYFATVRIASIILQYYLLEEGIGLGLMATFLKVQPSVSTISPIVPKICLVFIAVSALRQAFWALYLLDFPISIKASTSVLIFNVFFDTICSLASVFISEESISWFSFFAIITFFLGSYLESSFELQRKRFKMDPANDGIPYTGGWARYVQYPNYLGCLLWRTSFVILTRNMFVAFIPVYLLFDFGRTVLPELHEHAVKRYGLSYQQYAEKTSKLIPLLF